MLETMCHDVRVQQVSSLRRNRQICKFADDLNFLLVAMTELTLHLVDSPGEIGQHALNVADINLLLLKVLLQDGDPLLVTSSELFRLMLPLEVIVEEFSMTVRLPIQGL